MPGGIHPPSEVIASWPAPNYTNPKTRGQEVVVMEIILLAVCYIIVCLRIWTRLFQSKNFGWDDTVIIVNMIPLTGMAVALCLALSKYGWNRHVWDIPLSMLYAARKMGMVIQIMYIVSTNMTKVSILLFYRRLTSRVTTPFLYTVYGTIAFCTTFCIAGVITMLVGCRPLSAYWKQSNPAWLAAHEGKFYCYDEGTFIVIAATVSMVTDFLVCVLPMLLFLKLNIGTRQKFALAGIFGVGFFLCICGIVRMVKIIRTYYSTYDLTWSSEPVWVWTGIEAHMAVIIASLPAMNYLFRRILKDSSISSRLKTLTGVERGSRYDRAQSATNSASDQQTRSEYTKNKGSIHVVQEVRLEEFLKDKRYDSGAKIEDGRGVASLKEKVARSQARAWLDDDTSGDDSIHSFRMK